MKVKPGDRVVAVCRADREVVEIYGFGVYDGDFPKEMFGIQLSNPRITLDNGGIVWGCECWWGPESGFEKLKAGRKVVEVSLPDASEETCKYCGKPWIVSTSDTTGCCDDERRRAREAQGN